MRKWIRRACTQSSSLILSAQAQEGYSTRSLMCVCFVGGGGGYLHVCCHFVAASFVFMALFKLHVAVSTTV